MSLTPETHESLESLKESNRKDELLEEVKKASAELPELKEITPDSTKGEIIQAVEAALKNAAEAKAEAADDQPAEAIEAVDEDAAEQASEDADAIVAASEADAADEEFCECGEQPKGECEKETCLREDDSAEAEQSEEAERALNNLVDALNETKPLQRRAGSAGPFNRVLRR